MKSIEPYIRDVHDFPIKGIVFKDIAPLLQDSEGLKKCLESLKKIIPEGQKIDKVVGMESRGFLLEPCLPKNWTLDLY